MRGDWSGAELRSWRLSGAAPQPSRTELLYASSEEVGWSGDALRVIAGGRFLLRASQGRLIGRDWTLDVRAGEADVHVAGFAVDDARQELVVLRDHLLDRQFAFNGVPGRRSIAVFKLQPDGSLPELLRIIDGGPSLAADPRGLASDPARGEVTLSAGSPGALTTFSVDSPGGAPAVGSLPMADLGLASTWLTARGARGQLWAFQHPSRPLGEPAAADGSLASLLVFDAGAPRGPAASFSLEGTGTVMALLADHKRDELWLVSGDQPDVTGVPQAWSARVLALEGGRLVERGVRSLPAEAAALDPVRDEVWTLSDLGASAWPAALAAGVRPRLTIAAQGAPSAAPVVDGRSGELYLPVALGTEADRSWAVEVHDTGTGALLRTLRGVHADALAICR